MYDNKRLFKVDFGSSGDSIFSTFRDRPSMYVIARSYDEAAKKAAIALENESQGGCISPDGSLNISRPADVRQILMLCDNVIW